MDAALLQQKIGTPNGMGPGVGKSKSCHNAYVMKWKFISIKCEEGLFLHMNARDASSLWTPVLWIGF